MAKFYKTPRFIKVQKIDEFNQDRVKSDWVEVNEDGSPLEKSSPKKESKKTKE